MSIRDENGTKDLFSESLQINSKKQDEESSALQPLADRMRPVSLEDFQGQEHLLARDKPLYNAIKSAKLHSMIFWGPPGTGKTTLARLISKNINANFIKLSAVMAGVRDIRNAVTEAELGKKSGTGTILFVDEVHRFNKAQQDGFLPYIENGTFLFIGATTENPSFELNNALLSRTRVYVLKPLSDFAIEKIVEQALHDTGRGLGNLDLSIEPDAMKQIILAADGDARRALNFLEIASDLSDRLITTDLVSNVVSEGIRRFDKRGEAFYDQISALHKSVRGSDPDAALYWLIRMLDGGCDPLYIARRVVRMASEDIGNADLHSLNVALRAWDVQERLGSPEGELAIAQAVIYLACAPKSNAVYKAMKHAMADVKSTGSLEVPLHLRNAPTKLMKELDYGKNYRYAHDEENGFAAGESYLPENKDPVQYYHPVDRGLESKIASHLAMLRKMNQTQSKKEKQPS